MPSPTSRASTASSASRSRRGYQGIAFRKSDGELREAVTAALRGMIADGSYRAVLTKYGLAGNAVSEPTLNAATQ